MSDGYRSYREASIFGRRTILHEQLRIIRRAAGKMSLRCAECGCEVPLYDAYRCRWCNFSFCPSCAVKHFGPDTTDWSLP